MSERQNWCGLGCRVGDSQRFSSSHVVSTPLMWGVSTPERKCHMNDQMKAQILDTVMEMHFRELTSEQLQSNISKSVALLADSGAISEILLAVTNIDALYAIRSEAIMRQMLGAMCSLVSEIIELHRRGTKKARAPECAGGGA
jgi:hypothetical protein